MQIYLNYGRYWLLATPLLLLGIFSDIFMYAYWAFFILLTLNLIFEQTTGPVDSPASSINVYNQETRVNWLNLGIAAYLAAVNILVILIPFRSKAILVSIFWLIAAWILRRYIHRILGIIHRQALVSYLTLKLPGIPLNTLKEIVALYFPNDLPKQKPLQTRFELDKVQTEKLNHYYSRYILNNYPNATVPGENKAALPEPSK